MPTWLPMVIHGLGGSILSPTLREITDELRTVYGQRNLFVSGERTCHNTEAGRETGATEQVMTSHEHALAAAHPKVWAWIEANSGRNSFATGLRKWLNEQGRLTDKQMAAAELCAANTAAPMAEPPTPPRRLTNSPSRANLLYGAPVAPRAPMQQTSLECSPNMRVAFDAAIAHGLRRPQIRANGFHFYLAPNNPARIYIKDVNRRYLGNIINNVFFPRPNGCSVSQAMDIVQACRTPLETAVAYGRETGNCACCGRTLSDPVSVAQGIGPICARHFGLRR